MMTEDEKMRLVLDLAQEGLNQGELPIAAIIFLNDEIISKAYTTEKKDGRYLIHAEIKAMLEMDANKYSYKKRRKMELYTNLEPCMMCFGAVIHSFIGTVCYSIESPTDGGVVWVENTWDNYHKESIFKLPRVKKGILKKESKDLFHEHLALYPTGGLSDWVRTIL